LINKEIHLNEELAQSRDMAKHPVHSLQAKILAAQQAPSLLQRSHSRELLCSKLLLRGKNSNSADS